MDFKPAKDALAAADLPRLEYELKVLFPSDPELPRLHEWVNFTIHGGPPPVAVDPRSQVFLDNIARLRELRREPLLRTRPLGAPRRVPQELDFIADLGGVERWTLAHALNRLSLDLIEPTRSCAIVGTMRDDGLYILEWVAHYLTLGFEHLFVYTNDNADGSDAILAALAHHGLVTVMDSEVTGRVPPEAKAFGHSLDLLPELRQYDWALYVDSDEFLILADAYRHSMATLFAAIAANPLPIGGVCYDWLWFVSGQVFEREPGLLLERFQHARPHWLTKCLVRLRDVQSMRRQHHPELAPGYVMVDSALQPLDITTIWERRVAQYSGGRINHYWPRSFQEFAVKKARGAALGGEQNLYDRPYATFFKWNGFPTPGSHHPIDPVFLQAVKSTLQRLRRLEGVAEAVDRNEREYPQLLARIGDAATLRDHYARNRVEPGDL